MNLPSGHTIPEYGCGSVIFMVFPFPKAYWLRSAYLPGLFLDTYGISYPVRNLMGGPCNEEEKQECDP